MKIMLREKISKLNLKQKSVKQFKIQKKSPLHGSKNICCKKNIPNNLYRYILRCIGKARRMGKKQTLNQDTMITNLFNFSYASMTMTTTWMRGINSFLMRYNKNVVVGVNIIFVFNRHINTQPTHWQQCRNSISSSENYYNATGCFEWWS